MDCRPLHGHYPISSPRSRQTPYERVRMRPFSSRFVCFAEKIKFKDRAKEDRGDEHKWLHGLFLCMCPMTAQYVICHEEFLKIRKARSIKLLPNQSKWDPTLIEKVRSTPYDEHAGRDTWVGFKERPQKPGYQTWAQQSSATEKALYQGRESPTIWLHGWMSTLRPRATIWSRKNHEGALQPVP